MNSQGNEEEAHRQTDADLELGSWATELDDVQLNSSQNSIDCANDRKSREKEPTNKVVQNERDLTNTRVDEERSVKADQDKDAKSDSTKTKALLINAQYKAFKGLRQKTISMGVMQITCDTTFKELRTYIDEMLMWKSVSSKTKSEYFNFFCNGAQVCDGEEEESLKIIYHYAELCNYTVTCRPFKPDVIITHKVSEKAQKDWPNSDDRRAMDPIGFEESFKRVKTEDAKILGIKVKCVTFKDYDLMTYMRNVTSNDCFYQAVPQVPVRELVPYLNDFRMSFENCENSNPNAYLSISSYNDHFKNSVLPSFVGYIEREFVEFEAQIKMMIANGDITYDSIWYIFRKGQLVYTPSSIGTTCAEVISCFYTANVFKIIGKYIVSDGVNFKYEFADIYVPQFEGTRVIDELPVHSVSEKAKAMFLERGRKFSKIGLGHSFMAYNGSLFSRTPWYNTQSFQAHGRIMCDILTFNRMNQSYAQDCSSQFEHEYDTGADSASVLGSKEALSKLKFKKVPKCELAICTPVIKGFSFACKKWGEFLVDDIEEIEYDEEAFSRLVLDEDKKELVESLVTQHDGEFCDIVSGKGGGVIFLLHGPPGTGKTLTAEAIAELLHRPLYSVTVGELGTTPAQLEAKLQEILAVAHTWNAVTLLDEADIFLEARSELDIIRNAMVGVFLRLLEYHQGVLFLTTNRVAAFDQAFHSRVSIALHYEALGNDCREQVWTNLLHAAGLGHTVSKAEVEMLAQHEINGRQIKNAIRIAITLAKRSQEPVSKAHLMRTIACANDFKNELQGEQFK